MVIVLQLVPTAVAITLDLFSEIVDGSPPDTTPVNGSPIPGTAVTNRPGRFTFDLAGIPPGRMMAWTAKSLQQSYGSAASSRESCPF